MFIVTAVSNRHLSIPNGLSELSSKYNRDEKSVVRMIKVDMTERSILPLQLEFL